MAVYTVLTQHDIDAIAVTLDLGSITQWRGVSAGIENSTYFLTCQHPGDTESEYVLTIAENTDVSDVRFVAEWMIRLDGNGLPVPAPLQHRHLGSPLLTLHNKPALVVPKVEGKHLLAPELMHCSAIGRFLGAMHRLALTSGIHHTSPRGLDWLTTTAQRLLPRINAEDRLLLNEELVRLAQLQAAGLPGGIIHGDLFRDNALFKGDSLVAVIDFFMAGDGPLALDLAIAANDWCSHTDGRLDPPRAKAILEGYECERPLTTIERQHWPDLLCLAATRFWVSRLQVRWEPRRHGSGALPGSKDPDDLRALLQQRRQLR